MSYNVIIIRNGGIDMSVIDLIPSFYYMCIKDREGKEQIFMEGDITPGSSKQRLDLFEDKNAFYNWIKKEREVLALGEFWGSHEIYGRLYPKKIFITEFSDLIEENKDIDSITVIDKNGFRRLYFRNDFEYGYDTFPASNQVLHPREPIYIINRQRKLDGQIILQKESYFVTYPVVATPLFSAGIIEWADDLISRKLNQGYYIEQTTLYDVYMRAELESKDPGFFILSCEEAPHYILRKSDLKKMIENTVNYK